MRAPNIAANGDFEAGIASWYGQKLSSDGSTILSAPELISAETADTWNGTAGSLRVTIAKDPEYRYHSHHSGAICRFSRIVPANTTVLINFYAKSLSGGTSVSVSRLWGHGAARVVIGPMWQQYQMSLRLVHDTDALVFSLVAPGDFVTLADGVFLLDQVNVTTSPRSVLFCSPQGLSDGWIDIQYLNELHDSGFEVDYTSSLDEVTWDRIRQYNALVLYLTPETQSLLFDSPEPAAGRNEEFINLVEQFLEDGGGVFLFPQEFNTTKKQMLYDFTRPWGARLPIERIVENDEAKRGRLDHASYEVPIARTDGVLPSPITSGLSQLWYPTMPAHNGAQSGPIEVDATWTVVAKASATAQSEPIDLRSSGHPPPEDRYQRPDGVAAPDLMAIRSYKNGRVALLNQWPQFTIGSGVKWIYDRQVLSRGAKGEPSDWGALLENTFDWLCQPSLETGAVGGYLTPAGRLLAPNEQPSVRDEYQYTATWDQFQARWSKKPEYPELYRGLIGAKTRFSSGTSTVQQYARAAKAAGLKFIVFLDDFDRLTPKTFAQLKADCVTHSDSEVSLIPGFTIDANTGDRMFFFSPDGLWPPPNVLTGPSNTLFNLQPQDADGNYTGNLGDSFAWMFDYDDKSGNIGYYHFTGSPKRMKISDLRMYGMAALRYYRRGALVEDVTKDYLTCAQGTIPPIPVSFNEVHSVAALTAEARSGRALTFVRAESVPAIFKDGLWWPHQYATFNTFLSDGPLVHAWAETVRHSTYGAEEFVTQPGVMASRIEVSATNDLKEIAIYNGSDLFRRLAISGRKRKWFTDLFLGKSVQKNLVLIATDQRNRKAVSFARRCWKDGGGEVVFASDRINDGRMSLAHGPTRMHAHSVVPLPHDVAGYTWDGGPTANLPLATLESRPRLDSSSGMEDATRFNQTPLLEFTDEGALAVTSEQNELFDPSVLNVANPWQTFGPLGGPSRLFSAKLRYREYLSPTLRVSGVGWAGNGRRHGINASLFRSEVTFRTNLTVNSLLLLRNFTYPQIAPDYFAYGLAPLYFAYGRAPATVSEVLNLSLEGVSRTLTLNPGDWFALYSGGATASHIFIVRGQRVRIVVASRAPQLEIWADMEGVAVAGNETRAWELFSLGVPVDVTINDIAGVTSRLAYLNAPTGLRVLRGRRATSPGFIEIVPRDFSAEVFVPTSPGAEDMTLPLRVSGLNPRWTAGLLQRKGFVKGDYGTGDNRYREVGVDAYGYGYVPMYPGLAARTRMLVGHPVTADGAGEQLFIQVTHLYDNPHHWHVSVNNPTTGKITTTLHQRMALPGLTVPKTGTEITLEAGEYLVLVKE